MALDTLISQIAYRAHLLERALHDEGPWSLRLEHGDYGVDCPAERNFISDGVIFTAVMPEFSVSSGHLSLCLRGEQVSIQAVDVIPGAGASEVNWTLRGHICDLEHRS